ncbi:uncharacterized protein PV09_01341 [Verruconis gallopava]|uniref:Uncharacterized protein n=1 Tax=Verruconis gallopava TaxID=253628 RepID=A0A0D2AP33_9PEZI|nr:uncharacterized protein PV09_01341 [Verruconis gallopava]KIW08438.1 hypothetical protein PV09_01341 [Verruconis gallopava]
MADFAPYQDVPPERERALSPQQNNVRSPTLSPRPEQQQRRESAKNIGTAAAQTPISPRHVGGFFPPGGGWGDGDVEHGYGDRTAGFGSGGGVAREDVDLFETRLGIRMDWEACLAYLLLPPAGGVLLLVLEHKSDYVRFHAWQSSLLFTFLFVVHIIFSWSSILSWLILCGDLCLIAMLTFRAYVDATTLDRYEVPFFGPLASSILDDE